MIRTAPIPVSPNPRTTLRKWPRGKFNGQRIGGFELKIELNFAWIDWGWGWKWQKYIHLGPLHVWAATAYER